MEKREYVKRLKSMLANKKDTCSWCPCTKHYDPDEETTFQNCRTCQNFVGLKYKSSIHHALFCPCERPGKLGAVTRALKKIDEYEAKFGEV